MENLRKYLGAGAPDEQLSTAITTGKNYAALLSKEDLKLPDAVRGFFYFSDFVMNSVLNCRPRRSRFAFGGSVSRSVMRS